ncbi:MAG: hypothetical protein JWL85_55 [Candidatus Saccharibacteria bacterium]|nr:hypothetical protein [Candidatus Saccharibacteria bacterium]
MSAEFVDASAETLHAMETAIQDNMFTLLQAPLAEHIRFFAVRESEADAILHSFLGAVAADLPKLNEYLAEINGDVADHAIFPPPRLSDRPEPQLRIHADSKKYGFVCVRYLTANRFPTLIADIPSHRAGTIARMTHGQTLHRRPQIEATPKAPRLLMAVDLCAAYKP